MIVLRSAMKIGEVFVESIMYARVGSTKLHDDALVRVCTYLHDDA